jgi:hypothetical protein
MNITSNDLLLSNMVKAYVSMSAGAASVEKRVSDSMNRLRGSESPAVQFVAIAVIVVAIAVILAILVGATIYCRQQGYRGWSGSWYTTGPWYNGTLFVGCVG